MSDSSIKKPVGTINDRGQVSTVKYAVGPNRFTRYARVWFGLAIFVFVILSYDNVYHRWWYLSLAFGALVLILQLTRFALIRVYALWAGVFWVIQAIISLAVVDPDFHVLLPNQKYQLNVVEGLPGIQGTQHISTDDRGFRTTVPIDYSDETPVRIIAIGGSTTEQMLLDDHHTFTHLLQVALQAETNAKVEVVNTGVSGLRAVHHIATLKKALTMRPDMVLIMMGVNDWNRHIHLSFPGAPETVRDRAFPAWQVGIRLRNTLLGQALLAIVTITEQKNEDGREDVRFTHGEYYTSQNDSLNREVTRTFKPTNVSDEYARQLATMLDICRQADPVCLFLTQPNAYQDAGDEVKRHFWMTPPNTEYTLDQASMSHIARLYNDYLVRQAKDKGMPVCDIASKTSPTTENFYDDVHFNTTGASRVADLLLPCVIQSLAIF